MTEVDAVADVAEDGHLGALGATTVACQFLAPASQSSASTTGVGSNRPGTRGTATSAPPKVRNQVDSEAKATAAARSRFRTWARRGPW
jgi:hypothetical protein